MEVADALEHLAHDMTRIVDSFFKDVPPSAIIARTGVATLLFGAVIASAPRPPTICATSPTWRWRPVSIFTVAVMPARSGGSPACGSRRSCTGRRCTTLTQLPAGVLRRQDREFRAGRRAEALDHRLPGHVGIDVEHDRGLLADLHVGELGLLEVGLDPRPAHHDQHEQRRRGLDLLALLHAHIDHDAVDRRARSWCAPGRARRARARRSCRAPADARRPEACGSPFSAASTRCSFSRTVADAVGGGARVVLRLVELADRGHALDGQLLLALRLAHEVVGARLGVGQLAPVSRQVPRRVSTWVRAVSSSASALSSASWNGRESMVISVSPAATA